MLEIVRVTHGGLNFGCSPGTCSPGDNCAPDCMPEGSCNPTRKRQLKLNCAPGEEPPDDCVPSSHCPPLRSSIRVGCNPDVCTPDCKCGPDMDDCQPVWD